MYNHTLLPSLPPSLTPSSDRRLMVIGELIDTEQRYIHNLEILLNVYLPELEHVVAPRDLRLLFPAQLEPLLERHRELLGRLEERARVGSQFAGIVGDIFGQLCDGGNVSKRSLSFEGHRECPR